MFRKHMAVPVSKAAADLLAKNVLTFNTVLITPMVIQHHSHFQTRLLPIVLYAKTDVVPSISLFSVHLLTRSGTFVTQDQTM